MSEHAVRPPRTFRRDVLWNFGSLAVLGVSGIALNSLIGRLYGAAALGVFNQVWAAYVFFSQIAVGGIDLSVLKSVAESPRDRKRVFDVAIGALLPTLLLASATTACFWLARGELARLLDSESVALGIEAATPGLFFFALNKVLLAVENGLQRMRSFAVLQSCRFALILVGFWVAWRTGMEGAQLAFVFTFAEGILFVVLAVEVGRRLAWSLHAAWRPWARAHLAYGLKSFLSGVLLDLNSRVDVLMLGVFLGDAAVGIYSYAAMLAEGAFQLLVKLQNNYNPLIAQAVVTGRLGDLEAMVRKGRKWAWLLMAAVGAIAVALYPTVLRVLVDDPAFQASRLPFAVLMGGIFLAAGYMPFQQTLLMANRPGWHTGMMLAMVATNVAGNAALIPIWDLAGSAAATGLAMVVSVLILRWMVRREVGARI